MIPIYTHSLISADSGKLVLRVAPLAEIIAPLALQRDPLYAVMLVTSGNGKLRLELEEHSFAVGDLICTTPYQPYSLEGEAFDGFIIQFHSDFFCIFKHQVEVACDGVLFNAIYEKPFHPLSDEVAKALHEIALKMQSELEHESLAQSELLLSYLKIFLITASRSKATQLNVEPTASTPSPFILKKLKDAIESHYKRKHTPGDYADLLNISPKALGKITRTYYQKTVSDLINERIVIEAKRELYLTGKSVKAIAHDLGFDDEFYFSRFFKNKTDVSPHHFRTHVGFAKG